VRQTDVKDRAMTQDDINNGRLVCVIAIAPGKPAEFVIFRIQQAQGEALDQPATRADQISRSRIRTSVRS
jgi:phage tail sheath protein FI